MKSVVLMPYCPWPAQTGTKVEMMKHMEMLKSLGSCTVASAQGRPVGFGWTKEARRELIRQGYTLIFQEEALGGKTPMQWLGMAYGAFCKALKMNKAFGHANPYHRFAFSETWWREVTRGADLAVMQYGFWVRFKTTCPQVVILHELLSNYHWGGTRKETRELRQANLVIVVGHDEEQALRERGLPNVIWSPPAVPPMNLPLSPEVGIIGTMDPQNMEGLSWLEKSTHGEPPIVFVYGGMAKAVSAPFLKPIGRYEERFEPYRHCGIFLMTRDDRPGLQIKAVEALACGRAIVARKGSMRGLPVGKGAWIEVNSPDEMLTVAKNLRDDQKARETLAAVARRFYCQHLEEKQVLLRLREAYKRLADEAC